MTTDPENRDHALENLELAVMGTVDRLLDLVLEAPPELCPRLTDEAGALVDSLQELAKNIDTQLDHVKMPEACQVAPCESTPDTLKVPAGDGSEVEAAPIRGVHLDRCHAPDGWRLLETAEAVFEGSAVIHSFFQHITTKTYWRATRKISRNHYWAGSRWHCTPEAGVLLAPMDGNIKNGRLVDKTVVLREGSFEWVLHKSLKSAAKESTK